MPLLNVVMLAGAAAAPPAAEAACGPADKASAVCLALLRSTGSTLLARASDALVVRPARIALILAVAFAVRRLVRRAIRRFVRGMHGERARQRLGAIRERAPAALLDTDEVPAARRAQRAETIGALLRSVSSAVIWSVAILMALSELGLDLAPLVAGAGIVGVAVGFGAQHLVRDFVSGVFMLIEDQYGVGDLVDAGPATGKVEGVTLRTTRLRDVDGTVWHIPNGEIARVGNKSQQWSRAVLDVGVAYETDVSHASEVIKRAADEMWRDPAFAGQVLEEPEVWGVEDLGADGIVIRLVVKTAPAEQLGVARQLRARLKAAFDEAGIEIPFPQRTVWHRLEQGSAALVPVGQDGG